MGFLIWWDWAPDPWLGREDLQELRASELKRSARNQEAGKGEDQGTSPDRSRSRLRNLVDPAD